MKRKVFERRVIAGLVVLLIGEMTLLALHLGWGGFAPPPKAADAILAGHVEKTENDLRRRGANSLVWEKSSSDDSLYYYDSILTLSQSTASLKLFKDTEVHLSENTLVTIEPQDQKGTGEIRLKFTRGNLQARNPHAPARVSSENESWYMDVKTGTELELRQVGDGDFELGVKKGEVGFFSDKGQETVSENQMLRVNKDVPTRLEVEKSLQWIELPPRRIYTHGDGANLDLKWKEPAAGNMVLQTIGAEESVLALTPGETSHSLHLPIGRHQIFLREGGKTSVGLNVEVWRAPLLHLLAPLPRNRVSLGTPTQFVWMSSPEVVSYDLSVKGAKKIWNETRAENSFGLNFDMEDDVEWTVEGRDRDGFVIPALYSYPLFIREAPLAAPKLMQPQLRKPAVDDGRGAFLWNWILPRAFAEEVSYQALFRWEPVDGADHYVIEISENADFRNPVVNKVVSQPEFVWKKMDLQVYYWRVAAEAKNGHMGLFSEPQEVNLTPGADSGTVEVTPIPVPAKKVPRPVPQVAAVEPPPTPTSPPAPAPPEPPSSPPPPALTPSPVLLKERPHNFFEWRPLVTQISQTAPEDVKTKLKGVSPISFSAGLERRSSEERFVRVQLDVTQRLYKPEPAAQFPAQGDLQWFDVDLFMVKHKTSGHYGIGYYAMHSAIVRRESLASVQASDAFNLGMMLEGYYQFSGLEYVGDYVGVIGTQYGVLTRQSLRIPVGQMYFAVGAEGAWLFHAGGSTQSVSGQASLGFDF